MKTGILFFLMCFSLNSLSQDSAFVVIRPETEYPYTDYIQKNRLNWKFNCVPIRYQPGKTTIPVNSTPFFDTLEINNFQIQSKRSSSKKEAFAPASFYVLCKFHPQCQYALAQIFPGDFALFCLDTFNSKQRIRVEIEDFHQPDTLFLHVDHVVYSITSDTTLDYFNENKTMRNQFIATIRLDDRPSVLEEKDTKKKDLPLFDLNYLFLHGETVRIRINLRENTSLVLLES